MQNLQATICIAIYLEYCRKQLHIRDGCRDTQNKAMSMHMHGNIFIALDSASAAYARLVLMHNLKAIQMFAPHLYTSERRLSTVHGEARPSDAVLRSAICFHNRLGNMSLQLDRLTTCSSSAGSSMATKAPGQLFFKHTWDTL